MDSMNFPLFCIILYLFLFSVLMFITLLFKLGICQCVVKSICKMSCAACAAYWFAIGEMVSCLWHSLTNVKRVRRRRKRLSDIEAATYDYPTDDESSSLDSRMTNIRPKRRRRLGSKHNHHHHGSNRNNRRLIRLPSRQMSVRVGGKSRRVRSARRKIKSRRVKILKVKDLVD